MRPSTEQPPGPDFADLYAREIGRFVRELGAYEREEELWTVHGRQGNAPGTLALHIAGNLRHYIGAGLGGTGYVRDRPAEFGRRDVPRAELIAELERCRAEIDPVLRGLTGADMASVYPGEPPERMQGITTRAFLLHLLWHMGWHLGQLYYHRLGGQEASD